MTPRVSLSCIILRRHKASQTSLVIFLSTFSCHFCFPRLVFGGCSCCSVLRSLSPSSLLSPLLASLLLRRLKQQQEKYNHIFSGTSMCFFFIYLVSMFFCITFKFLCVVLLISSHCLCLISSRAAECVRLIGSNTKKCA